MTLGSADVRKEIVQRLKSEIRASLADFVNLDLSVYGRLLVDQQTSNGLCSERPRAGPWASKHLPLRLQFLLRALVEEGVSIADDRVVLAAVASANTEAEAIQIARWAQRDKLPGNEGGRLNLVLDVDFESALEQAICQDACGREVLALSPENTDELFTAIRSSLDGRPEENCVLLTQSGRLRPLLRRLTVVSFPRLPVLTTSERRDEAGQEAPIKVAKSKGRFSGMAQLLKANEIYPEFSTSAYLEFMLRGFFRGLRSMLDMPDLGEEDLETVYALGYNLFVYGRYSDAAEVFRGLLRRRGAKSHHWRALGATQQQTGQYSDAIRAYTEAINSDEQDLVSLVYRAECRLLLGDMTNARLDLKKVTEAKVERDHWKDRADLLLKRMEIQCLHTS